MRFKKNLLKLISVFCVLLCAFCFSPVYAAAEEYKYVYLGGFPAGFLLNTTSVEVIGICDVMTADGVKSPARESGIATGDVIDKISGIDVKSISDISKIVTSSEKEYEIDILRGNDLLSLKIKPAKDMASGSVRLGVLVKDSVNGIGTVTYIDKVKGKFATLGHPVTDLNGNMMEISGGKVFGCMVYEVKKGVKGNPGELHGVFENGTIIGDSCYNCPCGVYGNLNEDFRTEKLTRIEKGKADDVKIGKACIYSTIYGNTPEKYEISIVKVDKTNKDNRNYVIKIDDDRLLDKSGGIVQGMSGSPIVQNGKLIGAVTHVFVNDPTRGYGISLDKMLGSY